MFGTFTRRTEHGFLRIGWAIRYYNGTEYSTATYRMFYDLPNQRRMQVHVWQGVYHPDAPTAATKVMAYRKVSL